MHISPPKQDDELPVIFNRATEEAADPESPVDENYLANIVLEFPSDIEPIYNPVTTEAAEDEIDEASK